MSASDIAISVRGLSKSYTISHNQEKHSALAETLFHRLRSPLRRPQKETFWALKDVSLDFKKGGSQTLDCPSDFMNAADGSAALTPQAG